MGGREGNVEEGRGSRGVVEWMDAWIDCILLLAGFIDRLAGWLAWLIAFLVS